MQHNYALVRVSNLLLKGVLERLAPSVNNVGLVQFLKR